MGVACMSSLHPESLVVWQIFCSVNSSLQREGWCSAGVYLLCCMEIVATWPVQLLPTAWFREPEATALVASRRCWHSGVSILARIILIKPSVHRVAGLSY